MYFPLQESPSNLLPALLPSELLRLDPVNIALLTYGDVILGRLSLRIGINCCHSL